MTAKFQLWMAAALMARGALGAMTVHECMRRPPQTLKPYSNGPQLTVRVGDAAPDFVLHEAGTEFKRHAAAPRVSLYTLLNTKPVLLAFVSSTCPMTHASYPAILRLKETFGESFHFVGVYVAEARPSNGTLGFGGVEPYGGDSVADGDPLAIVAQPWTFGLRMKAATNFTTAFDGIYEGLFHHLLVDDVVDDSTTDFHFNPTWCRYGPMPNGGWVIGMDKTVKVAQMFISHDRAPPTDRIEAGEKTLATAMKALVRKDEL